MKRASILLAGVTLVAAAMAAAPRTVTAQPPSSPLDPASSCTSYDLLLLIDRSSSLGRTDPSFRRLDAAKELVDGLSGVASEQLPVTISVAQFGSRRPFAGRVPLRIVRSVRRPSRRRWR